MDENGTNRPDEQTGRTGQLGQTGATGELNGASTRPAQSAQARAAKQPASGGLRWMLWLVLLLPLVYMLVQVFIVLRPRVGTEVAIGDTMTDAVEAKGFVSLETMPLVGGTGALYYTVPAGQRVATGSEVALVFAGRAEADAQSRLQAIETELSLLEEAAATGVETANMDVLLDQMDNGVFQYRDALEKGDYAAIDEARDEMTLAANKIQNITDQGVDFTSRMGRLKAEQATLAASAKAVGTLTSTETGFFAPSARYDRKIPSPATLANYTPAQLQQALDAAPEYYAEDVSGHIITDYKWRFYTVVPLAEAERFAEGVKLDITFPETMDETLPAQVESMQPDEEAGIAKVALLCENVSPAVLGLRAEQAQLVFKQQKGLRIDKKALRVIEGEKCVYVKFGNQVFQRKVNVLLEDENYVLVSAVYEAGVNELQMYDEVVVETGGVELYDAKIL